MVTCGALYWPATSVPSGLSAPSTWTRTRYVPALTPLMGMVMLALGLGGARWWAQLMPGRSAEAVGRCRALGLSGGLATGRLNAFSNKTTRCASPIAGVTVRLHVRRARVIPVPCRLAGPPVRRCAGARQTPRHSIRRRDAGVGGSPMSLRWITCTPCTPAGRVAGIGTMICVSLTSSSAGRHLDAADVHQRVVAAQLSANDDQVVAGENGLIRPR